MRFSELDGRTVGVWGVGRETRSFADQLAARLPSARIGVVVLDDLTQPIADPGLRSVPRVGPGEAVAALNGCDVVVRSPGVSIYRPELQSLLHDGVPVTTSTGLWLDEHGPRNVIGVTGTKGKSTTATILHHLSAQRRPTHLAGNIGRPALDLLNLAADEWVVLELSSYQTADLPVSPAVGVITNLYPEHINWHGTTVRYRRDKLKLFARPGIAAAVYHPGDAEVDAAVAAVGRTLAFATPEGWHVNDGTVSVQHGGDEPVPLNAFGLRGHHNAENLCAALTALQAAELDPPELPAGLRNVPALAHRLQTVHQAAGIEWVDDSISTTPESSLAALAAFPSGRVVLIAGGQDREQDYRALAEAVVRRGDGLVTLPLTGSRLAADARAAGIADARLVTAQDMEGAVLAARRLAGEHGEDGGDAVVLLSPAAPSYHAYTNFEARGDHFAALARG